VDEAEVPSETTTTVVVLDVCCVGWHCCAVVQDAIATPEEAANSTMMRKWEVAVPGRMQMQEPNIYCSGSFKLVQERFCCFTVL
jgi:hypothetical protein